MKYFPVDTPLNDFYNKAWLRDKDLDDTAFFGGLFGSMGSTVIAGPLGLMTTPWLFFLFLPLAIFFILILLYYVKPGVVNSATYGDPLLNEAMRAYYKCADDPFLKGYAKPLMKNILQHAKENKHDRWTSCGTCRPRVSALHQLAPSKQTSDDDIKAVENLLATRKVLESNPNASLDEIMAKIESRSLA